jgi:hypothetical protein
MIVRTTLILIALISFFSGCSSYHLGSGKELPFRKIYVSPVENRSKAPQIKAVVTNLVRERIRQEPGLSLASSESDADAVLEVDISRYDRDMSAAAEDTDLAQSYRLGIEASCSLLSSNNGRVYFRNRKVYAKNIAYNNEHITSAQRQNFPALADVLARKIVDEVTGIW